MRELAAGLLAAFVLWTVVCGPATETDGPAWFRQIRQADGSEFALGRDSDHPVVLVFWSEWAGPCQPLLAEVGRLADRARVVAVELDHAGRPADSSRSPQVEWTVASGDSVALMMDVTVLPTTVVLDGSGKELLRIEGSGGTVLAEIERAIASAEQVKDGP